MLLFSVSALSSFILSYLLFVYAMTPHSDKLKKRLLLAVKKTQGTLTKVQKMVENDEYCADIGQQINAAIGLMKSANLELMKDHLLCCGKRSLSRDEKEAEKFIEEFARIWDVSTRK